MGNFEGWNIESFQGVIDAAEQTHSPIIVGFNGGFLSATDRLAGKRLSWYAALGRAAAESAPVACGLLFNECPSDDWVALAIKSGFNLGRAGGCLGSLRSLRRTRLRAGSSRPRPRGCLEAEVGELPSGVAGHGSGGGSRTDQAWQHGSSRPPGSSSWP